jgi:hypothetical protein
MRLFLRGDRVQLLTPTPSGWTGTATVLNDQVTGDMVSLELDSGEPMPLFYAKETDLELLSEGEQP